MRQRCTRLSSMRAFACLCFGLVGLASAGAKLTKAGDANDRRARTLKDILQSIFQSGDQSRRVLPAHNPTSSSSPATSPHPTSPASPVSTSSKSSPSSLAPVSYKPTVTYAPASGGKGMMMPGGKGGGKGMMVTSKAPAHPPKTKAPVVPKTKAPVHSKSKKSKSAPKSKSKSKEAKKKLPSSKSKKGSKSHSSKSKISAPTKPPHTASPTITAAPVSSQPAAPSTSAPSPSPIPGGSSSVTLTLYQIGYVVSLTYIPSTEEVDGVVNATQAFLSELFQGLYANMVGFETTKVSDRLMLNAPYEIVYNSTIDFEPGTAVPSLDELNSQLQTAFTGDTKALYLSMLVELGPDNIFSQTTDVVFTFFETNADAANGQSTSSTDMSSPLVLAAIGAGTLALIVAAAATIHFFKHRGDSSPGAKLPPPDYATHAAESTTGAADYPQHGGSTATGDTHSCMSPTSNASHTDETEPASGATNHRNPRVYRLSRQAIGSSGMHLPSHRDGTNACIGPMQQTLSFEGDDDDDNDERWMNPSDNHHSSSTQGEAIPSTSESDESCERRRNHRVDQVPLPLLY